MGHDGEVLQSEDSDRTWSGLEGDTIEPTSGVPAFWNIVRTAATYRENLDEEDEEIGPEPHATNITDGTMLESGAQAALSRTFIGDATPRTNNLSLRADEHDTIHPDSKGLHSGETPAPTLATGDLETLFEAGARVIPLLRKDFGEAVEPGETEQLVSESDATYPQQGVAVLGLAHLTTHRLTFHAVLSRPEEEGPDSRILKAGPVMYHRTGLSRKRRVWAELSHDMMSLYHSSSDESRVRPYKTVSLSALKGVHPFDPDDPLCITLIFQEGLGARHGSLEVDTLENASSWRKEISAALAIYRQGRQTVLEQSMSTSLPPEEEGVRLCIPLHRIISFESRTWSAFATAVTFKLAVEDEGRNPNTKQTVWHEIQMDPSLPPGATLVPNTLASSYTTPSQLTLVILEGFHPQLLQKTIEIAKWRRMQRPSTLERSDQIIVDFNALSGAYKDSDESHAAGKDTPGHGRSKDVLKFARREFALGEDEEVWYSKCAIVKKVTRSVGYLIVSPRFLCFWSNGLVSNTKLRFPIHDVNRATALSDKLHIRSMSYTLEIEVKEHPGIRLSFRAEKDRDEAVEKITSSASRAKDKLDRLNLERGQLSPRPELLHTSSIASTSSAPSVTDQHIRVDSPMPIPESQVQLAPEELSVTQQLAPLSKIVERMKTRRIPLDLIPHIPKPINVPAMQESYRIPPQHFACLTIGSRGDVQPYIALALGLMKEGHEVTIVTHEEYKLWIEGYGIKHRTAGGDPGALMKLSVEHKMLSPAFFKEGLSNFRKWLDDLLIDSFTQVKASGATVLVESPSAMAGLHIAEALGIPYFRAFTMPWSRTTEYPHAFISPPEFVSGSLNYSTYVAFDQVFWVALAPHVNRWRKKTLGLGSTDLEHMAQAKIPFLYNFSPHVVPKPLDWNDTTMITGYWFLDNSDSDWSPPDSLIAFIDKARADQKPLVYVGFGSIVVPKPKAMTRNIVKAVLKSDVRIILNKGWSARVVGGGHDNEKDEPEPELPDEVYAVDKVPHDWLFPQCDAALHHGGAGTTGASLQAGIPTLIKPWFGDQFFWASRVHKLGAGLKVASLDSETIAEALTRATTDRMINERAQAVGEKIRLENGVDTAIRCLYMYLHRAGVRPPTSKHQSRSDSIKHMRGTKHQPPVSPSLGGITEADSLKGEEV
ncbi:hypothetical protein FRB94_010728 [Tulasnella sp. JGI-2019a]|nr:hypothetical protein FRB94_010728 [Tulasnella sp. JGI-2019a]